MNILHKTFTEYIKRFKEIFAIMMPILVLELVIGVLIQSGLLVADVFQTDKALLIAVGLGLVGVVVTCIMALVYIPATLKVFQRREEGESVAITTAVQSQKTWPQIWSFIQLSVCTCAMMIFYLIIGAVPGFLVVLGIDYFDLFSSQKVLSVVLLVAAVVSIVYFLLRNMTKVMYSFNIYLSSKGYTAWQSIKESIRLGKTYRSQILGTVFGVILIGILGNCIQAVLMFLLSPHEFMAQIHNPKYVPPTYFAVGTVLISVVISVVFTSALMYLYMSKKYQQVRELGEKNVC